MAHGVEARHLIDYPTHLIAAVNVAIVSALAASPTAEPLTHVRWFAVHLVTLFLSGSVLYVARFVFERRQHARIPLAVLAVLGAVVGLLKSASTVAAIEVWSLQILDESTAWARVVGAVVVGALLIPGLSVGLQILEDVGRSRDALVGARFVRRIADEQRGLVADLDALIDDLQNIRALVPRTSSRELAEHLRSVIDLRVKPLSKAFWAFENRELPRVAVSALWRWGNPTRGVRIVAVSGVWTLTTLSGSIGSLGISAAIQYSFTFGAVTVLAHSLLPRRIAREVFSRAWGVIVFAVGVAVLAQTILIATIGGFSPVPGWPLLVAGAAWHAILIVGLHVADAVRRLRIELSSESGSTRTAEFARLTAPARPGDYRKRNLSIDLHGRVQGRLLGLVWDSERSRQNIDVAEVLVELIDEIRLLSSAAEAHPITIKDTRVAMEQVTESWAGILDVHLALETRALLDSGAVIPEEIVEVLKEALINASRHGNASQVRIEFGELEPSVWEGSIADNGYGPRQGPRGLGSEIFDALCVWWCLTGEPDGGSRLSFRLRDRSG